MVCINGQIVRTHPVHPELSRATFVCEDCGVTTRNVLQQFRYTQVYPKDVAYAVAAGKGFVFSHRVASILSAWTGRGLVLMWMIPHLWTSRRLGSRLDSSPVFQQDSSLQRTQRVVTGNSSRAAAWIGPSNFRCDYSRWNGGVCATWRSMHAHRHTNCHTRHCPAEHTWLVPTSSQNDGCSDAGSVCRTEGRDRRRQSWTCLRERHRFDWLEGAWRSRPQL